MRSLLKTAHYTLLLLLLLSALALLSVRFALPLLFDYRTEAQRLLSNHLQQSVSLQQFELDWWRWGPELRLAGLVIHDGDVPIATIEQAQARIDLVRSLWHGQWILSALRVQGGDVTLNWPAMSQQGKPLARLQGLNRVDIELDRVQLRAPTVALPPIRLHLQGQREATQWRWQALLQDRIVLDLEHQAGTWQGRVRDLQLADLNNYIEQFWPQATYRSWLTRLRPQGLISALEFSWQAQGGDWRLDAAMADLSSQAWGNIPALQGINARLRVNQDGGRLDLNGDTLELDWRLLSQGITLDEIAGSLHWRQSPRGLSFNSSGLRVLNSDLALQLRGQVLIPADDPTNPELDVQADYRVSDSTRVVAYLPTAIMKPKLVAWLERALGTGQIPRGRLLWRGRVADFPYAEGAGEFELRFQVAGMRLDYFPGWTPIDNLAAEVVFQRQGFDVLATQGTLGGSTLQEVKARIPDLRQAELEINAQLHGPTAAMLDVVANSPLREKLGARLAVLQASGNNDLALKLLIPIKKKQASEPKKKPVQVEGRIEFQGAQLRLPAPAPALDNLRGVLAFSADNMSAADLRLDFLGAPARLTVQSSQQTHDFTLRGRFDSAALFTPHKPAFGKYLRGVSNWTLALSLARQDTGRNNFILDLQSDLSGTAILLPPPLGKTAAVERLARLRIVHENPKQLQARLDDNQGLSSVFRLQKADETGWRLPRGELLLGSDQIGRRAELPAVDEWVLQARVPQLVLQPSGESGGRLAAPAGLTAFDRCELSFGQVLLGDWQLLAVSLRGQQAADGYQFTLDGNDVAGELFLPTRIAAAEPVHLALSKLKLRPLPDAEKPAKPSASAKKNINPAAWPPLHAVINALTLGEQPLGSLQLKLQPLADGVKLQQLELSAPSQQLSASGEWRKRQGRERSRFAAKLYSETLGETLELLSIPLAVERAKTALSLELNWPGAPNAIDSAQLNGTLQVHIEEGLLSGIKPGLGRLVGLVNVSSLARRLSLGFSDMVEQGLAFDQVDGTIHFADGRASTEDLLLQGPAVNIAIQGWLGLQEQTLQQTVIVMPQISSSLALAGAVAGGPAVGAAMLLAGEVLKPGLEQAVNFRYSISGTLDEPQIEQVQLSPEASKALRGGGRK